MQRAAFRPLAVFTTLAVIACSGATHTPRVGAQPVARAKSSRSAARQQSGLAAIWAIDDGTKVLATALKHRLRHKNGIFDGKRIRLVAARNEIVAFQLILVGGAQRDTDGVSVRLGPIGAIKNGQLSKDPNRHFIGRRIELFLQHYLQIRRRSKGLVWQHETAMPKGFLGWVPDALIPLSSGQRFRVPARRNQGLWIDIYLPKDTPVGPQRGTLRVQIAGKPCRLPTCRLPVEIEVLPATLPDIPTAKTMLYFSGGDDDRGTLVARYYRAPWALDRIALQALRRRHYHLGRRHRVTLFVGKDALPDESLKRRLSGEAFAEAAGYEGPGQGIGQDMYSIHSYGGELRPRRARLWANWFRRHGAKATYFLYGWDEPPADLHRAVRRRARRARPVPTFVTTPYTATLPEVAIFCAHVQDYTRKLARQAKAAGKAMWIYNGTRPFSGSFAIDDVAISPRVNAWIQYKFGIERWFYWESTYYNDFQGKRGQIDIYRHPLNFSNRFGDAVNGDGLLIYPGRDLIYPQQDRKLALPLPSIRLKNWRRGLFDVEYLALATARGHKKRVDKLLARLIPRALGAETNAKQRVSWPEDGERWLAARLQLAQLLRR